MGRFYKTSAATYVDDKMFQLPADLMYNTLVKKDAAIDKVIDEGNEYQKALEIKNVDVDDPVVNEIMRGYQQKGNDITNAIYEKPLDFKRQQRNLAMLSRELDADLQRGTLSKAQANETAYNTMTASIDERKDLDPDVKVMGKKAIKQRYAESGGVMNEDGSYNNITDQEITLHSKVDTGKLLLEVGTNFRADKTAEASSIRTGTGYIRDKSSTSTFIPEGDIEGVMSSRLIQSGWEDSRKQYYELQNEVNGAEYDVDAEVKRERDMLIIEAKKKIGYTQETEAESLKTDVPYGADKAAARAKGGTDGGYIYGHYVDPRNTDAKETATFNKTGAKLQKLQNYLLANDKLTFKDPQQLAEQLANGTMTMAQINAAMEEIPEGSDRLTPGEFKSYMNNYLEQEHWQATHPEGATLTNAKYSKGVANKFNNQPDNTQLKEIRVSGAGRNYRTTAYTSTASFVENNTIGNYMYIPVGEEPGRDLLTRVDGYLADEDGVIIVVDDKMAKTREEAKRLGPEFIAQLSVDKEAAANYNTNKSPVMAEKDGSDIFQRYNIKLGDKNQISKILEHKLSKEYYRVPLTGKFSAKDLEYSNVDFIW